MPELDDQITLAETENALKSSKNGSDKITNEFLKNLPSTWKDKLTELYNQILTQEKIPKNWTKSKLCVLFKKGDKKEPSNYRGIALLNNVLKIFTTILANRLQRWAEAADLLCKNQFGFRK